MQRFGFGNQGAEQSRDCAFHVCVICNTNIRMSYFVVFFFVYRLVQILQSAANSQKNQTNINGQIILFELARACGDEFILLATILCHEFGHGNMCRWLGGEIDHILLWVFGGICFSRHPRSIDKSKVLRDDLLVVAAGPSTHFFQAPLWGILIYVLYSLWGSQTGYASAWDAFYGAMDPFDHFKSNTVQKEVGLWSSLPWIFAGDAITLNVWLFLFNVFFPMYPMDSVKILVLVQMFCCGATPRCAAITLLCVSVPCALYFVLSGFIGLLGWHGFGPPLMQGMMAWLGVMSLIEAYRIYDLLSKRQLHLHPLFSTARSFSSRGRDSHGQVNRINATDFDDDEPLVSGCGLFRKDVWCNLCCDTAPSVCCPCLFGPTTADKSNDYYDGGYGSAEAASSSAARSDRSAFLARLEQQNMESKKSVKEVLDERAPPANAPSRRTRDFGSGKLGSGV